MDKADFGNEYFPSIKDLDDRVPVLRHSSALGRCKYYRKKMNFVVH